MGFSGFGFLHFLIPQLHPLPPWARHAALPSAVCCGRVTFIFVGYFLNEFREQLFLHSCLPSFSFAHIGGGECIPAVPGEVCISLVQAAAGQCLIMGKMQPASFFLSSLVYFCREHSCSAGIWLAHKLLLSLPRIFGCKANLSKSLPLICSGSRTEVSFAKLGHSTVELLWGDGP